MKSLAKAMMLSAAFAGGAIIAPVAANAALSDCNTARMCMWANNDFKFEIGDRSAGSSTITNLSGDNNNEMDSWANKSSLYEGCMYGGANGTGDRQGMGVNSTDSNVGFANSDEVSSWRTRYGC